VRRRILLSLVASALAAAHTHAFDPSSILTKDLGFGTEDIRRIEAGEVVAHSLTAHPSEVAMVAVAVATIPIGFYLERFDQVDAFKKSDEVLQISRFSVPPVAGDLHSLTIDQGDIDALRECTPGDCEVKLDVAGISRTRSAADVAGAYRAHLGEYAARYLREGNAALMEHQDGKKRAVADGLTAIITRSPYLTRQWPEISSSIRDFNGTLPAGLRHFMYWSKEKSPGKAVISLTHAIIRPERDGVAVVATKQIYASHYLSASLGLTILVNKDTPAGPRTLIIYVNRTQTDVFEGVLAKVKRPIVRSRARTMAERLLTRLRTRLQAEWAARK